MKKRNICLAVVIILLSVLGFYYSSNTFLSDKQSNVEKTKHVIISVKEDKLNIVLDDAVTEESVFQQIKDNVEIKNGQLVGILSSIEIQKPGEYPVTITAIGDDGKEESVKMTVVLAPGALTSIDKCEKTWVADSEEHTEEIWVVDVKGEPAVTRDFWVVDAPAVKEQGHYEDTWIIDVPASEEQGHYETVMVEMPVDSVGHWEKKTVEGYTPGYALYNGEKVDYDEKMGYQAYKCIFDENNKHVDTVYFDIYYFGKGEVDIDDFFWNLYGYDYSGWRQTGYKYFVKGTDIEVDCLYAESRWTEEQDVWVEDVPAKPAVTEERYIVDSPATEEQGHWEKIWIVDVEGMAEQGHYETEVIKPAIEEQGHYEEITVPESGHYEFSGC